MFNKSKLFKLNILKAFHDDEERNLQKDVLKAMIIDELSEEEAEQMLTLQNEKRKREALKELGLPEDTDLKQLTAKTSEEPSDEATEPEDEPQDEIEEIEESDEDIDDEADIEDEDDLDDDDEDDEDETDEADDQDDEEEEQAPVADSKKS